MARSINLRLKSKDGKVFDVPKDIAKQIKFVNDMLEDVDEVDGMEIPMGEVRGNILEKVIAFCTFHHNNELTPSNADKIDTWEKEFVKVDKCTLFHLILAANFLAVQPLLDLTCKTVSDMIKGKTAEQIRDEFAIDESFIM